MKKINNSRNFLLSGLSSIAVLAVATPAVAQTESEGAVDSNVIIVTATKRDANLQDIPFSINAQTQSLWKTSAATLPV